MSGCSLHEAFPDTATQSGQKAKKEERAKAKRCQSPALAFLKATDDLDPDRQGQVPLPPAEKLKGREAFTTQKLIQGFTSSSGSQISQTAIGTSFTLVGTTINTLFGTSLKTLTTTITVQGRDSGARVSIPLIVTKNQ